MAFRDRKRSVPQHAFVGPDAAARSRGHRGRNVHYYRDHPAASRRPAAPRTRISRFNSRPAGNFVTLPRIESGSTEVNAWDTTRRVECRCGHRHHSSDAHYRCNHHAAPRLRAAPRPAPAPADRGSAITKLPPSSEPRFASRYAPTELNGADRSLPRTLPPLLPNVITTVTPALLRPAATRPLRPGSANFVSSTNRGSTEVNARDTTRRLECRCG